MVRPDGEAEDEDRHQRQRHQAVAEDRLAAHHRDHLADDPEAGQHHDVHRGMRVEPEDVLVAEHVAAAARFEEIRVQHTVEHHEELRAGDERRRDHDQHRGREVRPDEQRHAPERHPRRAHRDDRDEEVQRGHDRARAGPLDAHVEEHLAERLVRAERRVARPPGRRAAARHGHADEQHHAGDRQQPERQRVQARERHVGGADHERDHVVPEPGERRDHEQEDHQRRVVRDQGVERLRVEVLVARLRELRAEEHREEAADAEEDDRRDEVLDADHLVVGVDAEVVAPGAGAVAGVVVDPRRPAARVVGPVVEAADPGEEAERRRHELDRDEHRALPDGIPAGEPADEHGQPEPEPEEERRHPEHAQPARRRQAAQAGRRRRRSVFGCVLGHLPPPVRYCTSWSSLSGGIWFPKMCGIASGKPGWRYAPGFTIDSFDERGERCLAWPARRTARACRDRARRSRSRPAAFRVWQPPQPFCWKTARPGGPPAAGAALLLPGGEVGRRS